MKIITTIEARMTSTRLPGKVLFTANGKPMLEHLVNRLKQVASIEKIVLATTINQTDDCLVEFAENHNILSFRGSEEDVMSRVIGAGNAADADIIVEITGDCPLIDPLLVEQAIQLYLHNDCDYVCPAKSYPAGIGSVQVYSLEVLKRSAAMTDEPLVHEHVTLHIRRNKDLFKHLYMVAAPDQWWPELELVLDEQKDYEILKRVIEYFGAKNPFFSCQEIIQLFKSKPEWVEINREVKRKGDT